MHGRHEEQEVMLAHEDIEGRVPKDHPLRTIKTVADEALKRLSSEFDRMYSRVGRASVPPERLLKASLLISFYSVRSERAMAGWPEDAEVEEIGQPDSPTLKLVFESMEVLDIRAVRYEFHRRDVKRYTQTPEELDAFRQHITDFDALLDVPHEDDTEKPK